MKLNKAINKKFGDNPKNLNILDKNFLKFVDIIRNYYFESKTKEEVIECLNNKESKEMEALRRLMFIYSSAELDITNNLIKENKNIPNFNVLNINEESNSLEEFVSKSVVGKRVLIKPNLVSPGYYPETSSLSTINKLLHIISPNSSYVAIGDGPSLFFDSKPVIKRVRIFDGIDVIDFNKSKYIPCYKKSWSFLTKVEIPEEVYGFDVLVNLCVFKEHNSFVYSGASKNMMGLISPATRLKIHRLNDKYKKEAINELVDLFSPQIVVMDARRIMKYAQQRIYGGIPIYGPGIFYSKDPLDIDNKMIKYIKEEV